ASKLVVVTAPNSPSASGAVFTTQPAVQAQDQFGNPVLAAGTGVTASVPNGYALLGSATATTAASGTATFAGLGVAGAIGPVTVTFSSAALIATSAQVTLTAGTAAGLTKTAGDNQTATVNTPVATPPTVVVKDATGNPVAGVQVTFTVGANSGAVSSGGGVVTSVSVNTDATGSAQVNWQLGASAGTNTNTLSVPSGGQAVVFTASGVAAAASQLVVVTAPSTPTPSGAAFTTQPVISRRDQFGNPVLAAATVTASVPAGYTTVGTSTATTSATTGTASFSN